MVEEWPVAAQAADRKVERARVGGGGRLRTATLDFLLDPAERLTEQERAAMTAMLHGLVGSLADELRVRIPEHLARESEIEVAELVADLGRAGLLGEPLVALLLKRADASRVAQAGDSDGARQFLTQLAGDPSPQIAAAAMAVALARGRSRDRVRASVDFNDLDPLRAEQLVHAIAVVLARRSSAANEILAEAASDLLRRHDPTVGLDPVEQRLVAALYGAGRLDGATLLSFGARGEAGLVAHALARLADVAADDAWEMMAAPSNGRLATLLRMAGQSRQTAAALFVSIGPALGLHDPAAEIDRFDALTEAEVGAARRHLQLPPVYRAVLGAVDDHG